MTLFAWALLLALNSFLPQAVAWLLSPVLWVVRRQIKLMWDSLILPHARQDGRWCIASVFDYFLDALVKASNNSQCH